MNIDRSALCWCIHLAVYGLADSGAADATAIDVERNAAQTRIRGYAPHAALVQHEYLAML